MTTEPTPSEINELKKRLEENSDSLIFAALADAYRKTGDLQEALSVCKKGLEKNPTYTSARVVLGRIYREQGKVDDAVSEFRNVLELDPENLVAHSMLGEIYVDRNDYQTAIEEYQKVLTLNPDDEGTQAALKQAIERAAGEQKKGDAARMEVLSEEKKAPGKESTATLTIAELYSKQGHFDKAVEVYQELLGNDPHNLMLRQKLNELLERQQKQAAVDPSSPKLKQNEFTRPPDPKEDTIVDDPRMAPKRPGRVKREDDSKFSSDDILQVMRGGAKDDAVVEEKPPVPPKPPAPPEAPVQAPPPAAPPPKPEKAQEETPKPAPEPAAGPKASEPQGPDKEAADKLKVILGELGSVEGVLRCSLLGTGGTVLVSIGENSNETELGKQSQAIFQSTHRSVAQLEQGKLQQVLVTAETGHILLVSFGPYILIVIADRSANLGLLRLALDSANKKLDKIP